LPIELRPPVPAAASALLLRARHGLDEADREAEPATRFVAAYLSALRAAAAILAAQGRPHRGRARPESAWVLLEAAVPDLGPWATYFAANSATRAAAQAGITRRITDGTARELLGRATEFVALAHRTVHGDRGTRAAPCAATPRLPRQRSR
jgi:hypothetical protein